MVLEAGTLSSLPVVGVVPISLLVLAVVRYAPNRVLSAPSVVATLPCQSRGAPFGFMFVPPSLPGAVHLQLARAGTGLTTDCIVIPVGDVGGAATAPASRGLAVHARKRAAEKPVKGLRQCPLGFDARESTIATALRSSMPRPSAASRVAQP